MEPTRKPEAPPRQTSIGLRLLYLYWGLSAFGHAFVAVRPPVPGRGDLMLLSTTASLALVAGALYLVWLSSRRASWPRFVLAVLFVLVLAGNAFIPSDPLGWLSSRPVGFVLWLGYWLAFAPGLLLLFLPDSRAWFRGVDARGGTT